jgi:phosphatidylinositol phospholipase C delta
VDGDAIIRVGKAEKAKISDELAALGFYARSMKPAKGWFAESRFRFSPPSIPSSLRIILAIADPLHVLINISESACGALLPHALDQLITHSQSHLRRIFPKGTRIRSGVCAAILRPHTTTKST